MAVCAQCKDSPLSLDPTPAQVDFEGATVFLKKRAAGAAMQLRSRHVFELYTNQTTVATRWALYYGSLAHYMNCWMMDHTVFLLAYLLVVFVQGNVELHQLYLDGSSFSRPREYYEYPELKQMKKEPERLALLYTPYIAVVQKVSGPGDLPWT